MGSQNVDMELVCPDVRKLSGYGGESFIPEAAAVVETAIESVLEKTSLRTPDMGGKGTTEQLGKAIAAAV